MKLTVALLREKCSGDGGKLKNRTTVNLWGCGLHNVALLQKIPRLQVVSLSVNELQSLSVFADMKALRELYLRRNRIVDIDEFKHLSSLSSLRILWTADNPVANLTTYRQDVIRMLPQLTKLDNRNVTDNERYESKKSIDDDDVDVGKEVIVCDEQPSQAPIFTQTLTRILSVFTTLLQEFDEEQLAWIKRKLFDEHA